MYYIITSIKTAITHLYKVLSKITTCCGVMLLLRISNSTTSQKKIVASSKYFGGTSCFNISARATGLGNISFSSTLLR